MKITLVKSDSIDNWYTIEKLEHENKEEFRPTAYGAALWYSGRISDADVEGTEAEMRGIALAIEKKSSKRFKRCAVSWGEHDVEFWSPRNSTEHGVVSHDEATALAAEIFEKLGREPVAVVEW